MLPDAETVDTRVVGACSEMLACVVSDLGRSARTNVLDLDDGFNAIVGYASRRVARSGDVPNMVQFFCRGKYADKIRFVYDVCEGVMCRRTGVVVDELQRLLVSVEM